MTPQKAAAQLTDQIIKEFYLSTTLCYDFINSRIHMAISIGYDLGRTTSRKTKPVIQMNLQGKIINAYMTIRLAAGATDVGVTDISKVCMGKRKTAGGYKWKYADPDDYYKKRRIATLVKNQ